MSSTLDWLMEGDPVIRWQTMRDLLDRPASEWEAERSKTLNEGWGAQMLNAREANGHWKISRWTGDVWTLVVLTQCGVPASVGSCVHDNLARLYPSLKPEDVFKTMDLCHVGFWVGIGACFTPDDPRVGELAATLYKYQMADGGWNCRIRTKPKTTHSSFHTTFNALEGLSLAAHSGVIDKGQFQEAEDRALEFMLKHRLFKSDKTGEIVEERFLHLTFPSYWHYNLLRALDYIRSTRFADDPRLDDAFRYLESRKTGDGRWIVEKRIPGETIFDMEPMGKASRWNTLRALRAIKASGIASSA